MKRCNFVLLCWGYYLPSSKSQDTQLKLTCSLQQAACKVCWKGAVILSFKVLYVKQHKAATKHLIMWLHCKNSFLHALNFAYHQWIQTVCVSDSHKHKKKNEIKIGQCVSATIVPKLPESFASTSINSADSGGIQFRYRSLFCSGFVSSQGTWWPESGESGCPPRGLCTSSLAKVVLHGIKRLF